MKKTLRLIFPQWQGGMNPHYAEGARIMAMIAPAGKNHETVEIPVEEDFDKTPELSGGIYGESAIARQTEAAARILSQRQPERILTFGGDCSVSQAPFDYLHGKYPEDTGIIWLDAHPDISDPKDVSHEHAMVLGNLMGDGAKSVSKLVRNPFQPHQVLYAGLIQSGMLPYEKEKNERYQIPVVSPEELAAGTEPVVRWIRKNCLRHIMVHFDMDVLISEDFRSLLYNEPYLEPVDYATGRLTLAQAVRVITDVSIEAELVGLTIAEYLPWDVINIRREFAKIRLFD